MYYHTDDQGADVVRSLFSRVAVGIMSQWVL